MIRKKEEEENAVQQVNSRLSMAFECQSEKEIDGNENGQEGEEKDSSHHENSVNEDEQERDQNLNQQRDETVRYFLTPLGNNRNNTLNNTIAAGRNAHGTVERIDGSGQNQQSSDVTVRHFLVPHEHDDDDEEKSSDVTVRHFLVPHEHDDVDEESGSYGIGDDFNVASNNRSIGNNLVPGVERINPHSQPIVGQLPVAYPVSLREPEPEVYPVHTPRNPVVSSHEGQQQRQERQEEDGDTRSTGEEKKSCFNSILFAGILSLVILVTLLLSVNFRKTENKNSESEMNETTSNNSSFNYSSRPTLSPSAQRLSNNITSNSTSPLPFKCFTYPWEIYIYEELAYRDGVDPSILRTYHFCPNTLIKVQTYDHQFDRVHVKSGDTNGFLFFRPNVSVKCGFDGSYENNCTLSGGNFQFGLIPVSLLQTEVFVFPGPENITVEGFRFTQAYKGANILNLGFIQSLTLKNCVFDHNYEMQSGIMSAPHYAVESTLIIENCTFEHNTYKFFHGYYARANVGVIASHPVISENAIVNTHISNSVFRNETFLLDDEPETIPSPVKGEVSPDGVYVNAAIINIMTAWGVLDITDSYFIGNKGYTESLIIMDKDNRTVLRNVYGNSFVDNEPRDSSDDDDNLSCILLYQNISYENGWPMDVLNKEEESCSDQYFL